MMMCRIAVTSSDFQSAFVQINIPAGDNIFQTMIGSQISLLYN